jgi:TorA maturation chaperone TorD
MNQEETVNRALSRSYLYHLSSLLFLYPEETVLSSLGWEEAGEAVALLGSPDGLKETLESLKGSLKPVDGMRSEFSRVFGYTLQCDCPPYETLYGSGGYAGANTQLAGAQVFEQSQTLGDIAGFYRAFGLEVSDQIKERLDYISIELEFMSFLAYKEAYALISDGGEKEKAERIEICRDAQRKFLSDHLGRWAPFFTDRLEEKAKDGFYLWLARLTGKFLAFEIKAIEVQPMQVEGLAPIVPDTEGLCEKCVTKDTCFSDAGELSYESSESVF